MAQRILPGAYVSINDMSNLPEGQTALTVGYVLDAKRGPVNQVNLVTDPTDFLTQYTFSGKPNVSSDPTFWSILNVLRSTNSVYVSRAAKNPLYGGATLKATEDVTKFTGDNIVKVKSMTEPVENASGILTGSITFTAAPAVAVNDKIEVMGTYVGSDRVKTNVAFSGVVTTVNGNSISITEIKGIPNATAVPELAGEGEAVGYETLKVWKAPVSPLSDREIGTFSMNSTEGEDTKTFVFDGDIASKFALGLKFKVVTSGQFNENLPAADKISETEAVFTVLDNEDANPIDTENDGGSIKTIVKVTKDIFDPTAGLFTGTAYFLGLGKPSNLTMDSDELLLITGKDPGQYNNDIGIKITSSKDDSDMVYRSGNTVGGIKIDFDTIQLDVFNTNISNSEPIESFIFSRDINAKTIDGISLYVDNVVAGSAYITVVNNTEAVDKDDTYKQVPSSTFGDPITLRGGSNGEALDEAALEDALKGFYDKSVTVSILGNGCSTLAETKKFQQALMEVADTRKDLVVFLNNPYVDTEKNVTLPSQRAKNIVAYKKGELANTSFYGCMYAPHVNTTDIFNGGSRKIGAESVAIAGWLDVINNLNYPYAYAGPKNGLVQGVTCDWKIGDESGEAALMNDASINYVAFDAKVGRYYMQCQNTLQVANSSMRNIGTVLNVLDIKENFTVLLKEYLQLPITDNLRREIIDVSNDYLSPMLGVRFSNYTFQDVTTTYDLANNTLRYLLTIAPTPYAQRIYLVMNIVNATFDFSIVQAM